jgi:hypothetical protein
VKLAAGTTSREGYLPVSSFFFLWSFISNLTVGTI